MPGQISLTVGNELFTTTAMNHLEIVKNLKDQPQPFAEDAIKLGLVTEDGGERLVIPYEAFDHSRPTKISTGYESWDNWNQTTFAPGHESWAYIVQPVLISRRDKTLNSGKYKRIEIVKSRTENVYRHLMRQAQQAWVLGAVASGTHPGVSQWEDWLSINGADNATHLLEAVATGVNTVHNISRTTYPATTHMQLHNIFGDASNAAGTNLLQVLNRTKLISQRRGNPRGGGSFRWYASENCGVNLSQVLRGTSQMTYVNAGQKGTTNLDTDVQVWVAGAPMTTIELPNLGATTTTIKWSMVGIDWKEGIRLHMQKGHVFDMDPFMPIPGTISEAALFHVFGQLTVHHAGKCVVIARADTY